MSQRESVIRRLEEKADRIEKSRASHPNIRSDFSVRERALAERYGREDLIPERQNRTIQTEGGESYTMPESEFNKLSYADQLRFGKSGDITGTEKVGTVNVILAPQEPSEVQPGVKPGQKIVRMERGYTYRKPQEATQDVVGTRTGTRTEYYDLSIPPKPYRDFKPVYATVPVGGLFSLQQAVRPEPYNSIAFYRQEGARYPQARNPESMSSGTITQAALGTIPGMLQGRTMGLVLGVSGSIGRAIVSPQSKGAPFTPETYKQTGYIPPRNLSEFGMGSLSYVGETRSMMSESISYVRPHPVALYASGVQNVKKAVGWILVPSTSPLEPELVKLSEIKGSGVLSFGQLMNETRITTERGRARGTYTTGQLLTNQTYLPTVTTEKYNQRIVEPENLSKFGMGNLSYVGETRGMASSQFSYLKPDLRANFESSKSFGVRVGSLGYSAFEFIGGQAVGFAAWSPLTAYATYGAAQAMPKIALLANEVFVAQQLGTSESLPESLFIASANLPILGGQVVKEVGLPISDRLRGKTVQYEKAGVVVVEDVTIPTSYAKLKMFEGKSSLTTVHATYSGGGLTSESPLLPGAVGEIGAGRMRIDQRNFYGSTPINYRQRTVGKSMMTRIVSGENYKGGYVWKSQDLVGIEYPRAEYTMTTQKPAIYGGYVGIIGRESKAPSESRFSLFPQSAEAFIVREQYVYPLSQETRGMSARQIARKQSLIPYWTTAAENMRGMSNEGQLVIGTGYGGGSTEPIVKFAPNPQGKLFGKVTYYNQENFVLKAVGEAFGMGKTYHKVTGFIFGKQHRIVFQEVKIVQIRNPTVEERRIAVGEASRIKPQEPGINIKSYSSADMVSQSFLSLHTPPQTLSSRRSRSIASSGSFSLSSFSSPFGSSSSLSSSVSSSQSMSSSSVSRSVSSSSGSRSSSVSSSVSSSFGSSSSSSLSSSLSSSSSSTSSMSSISEPPEPPPSQSFNLIGRIKLRRAFGESSLKYSQKNVWRKSLTSTIFGGGMGKNAFGITGLSVRR